MKKLLSLMSAFVVTASAASSLVSCGHNPSDNSDAAKDQEKTAKLWLNNAVPDAIKSLGTKVFLSNYEVGKAKPGDTGILDFDYENFFKEFPKYGEATLANEIQLKSSAVLSTIFNKIDDNLKSQNAAIFTNLDENSHSNCENFLDSKHTILSVDHNLSSVFVEKYNWDPTNLEHKDIDQIGGGSDPNYAQTFKEQQEKATTPLKYAYKIKIDLVVKINYHVINTEESTSVDINDSTGNALTSILYDKDGAGVFKFFNDNVTKSLKDLLEKALINLDMQKLGENFTFASMKTALKSKLIDYLNNELFKKTPEFNLHVRVNDLNITYGGEWGDLDTNADILQYSSKAYINQVTNAGDIKAGMRLVTPVADAQAQTQSYFKDNETNFNKILLTNYTSYGDKQPDDFTWNGDISQIQNKIVSYGIITITNWSSSSTPLENSADVPYSIVNNKIGNNRLDYYDAKANPMAKNIFSNPETNASSFFNYFNLYNFQTHFDGKSIYDYIENSTVLKWALECLHIDPGFLKTWSLPNIGASIVQGVDSDKKDMSHFENNNYDYSTGYGSIMKNYYKNFDSADLDAPSASNFNFYFSPMQLGTDKVHWLSGGAWNHPEDYAVSYVSNLITSAVKDKDGKSVYETKQNDIYSSSTLFTSWEQLVVMFKTLANLSKDSSEANIIKALSDCAPKFNIIYDGITINFNPGITFNFALSYALNQSIAYNR